MRLLPATVALMLGWSAAAAGEDGGSSPEKELGKEPARDVTPPRESVKASAAGPDAGMPAPETASFKFGDPKNRDTVRFTVEAPFQIVNAVGNELFGDVTLKDGKLSGELKLLVSSIRTGSPIRDSHLRSDEWLDAKKHPFLTFTVKDLELAQELRDGQKQNLKTKGNFEVRGVTHEEPLELTVTYFKPSEQTSVRREGELLHLSAHFKLKLDHFKLETRKKMSQEVGDTAEVAVDAWGTTKP